MRRYELILILRPNLSETERKKLLKDIKKLLKEVKVVEEADWGSKALAYSIKHEKMGYYYDWKLETEAMIGADFEKKLISQENILRHLLIRKK